MSGGLTITGTHATNTADGASVMPFSGVTITDSTPGATDTLKITYNGDGQISGVARSGATTSDSNGGYRITGTAAQVTAGLRAVGFTPQPPQAGRTTEDSLYLDVSSSSPTGYASDSNTVVYDTTAPDTVSFSPQVTYRDGSFTLTGAVTTALGVTGVDVQAIVDGVPTDLGQAELGADGNFTFEDRVGRHTQGFITAITENASNQGGYSSARSTASFSLTGGLGPNGDQARQTRYTADGSAVAAVTRFLADGSERVSVQAGGETFASSSFDTFNNGGVPDTTFVFDPGFGKDVVNLFRVDGADHDALSLKGSDYGDSIANVLAAAQDTKAGLLITDPVASSPGGGPGAHDKVLLTGITRDQLVANPNDIKFHA